MRVAQAVTPLTLLTVFLPVSVFTKICHRLNPSLFQRCLKLGYNHTALLPEKNASQENIIASNLERDTKQFEKCSEYLDIIMCAIFVPKCEEENYSPILPCRQVCVDFVKDCEAKVTNEKLEWIKGLCRLLPARRSNNTDCLEPANYNPGDNSIPLIQNCTKLQMSSCSYLGYSSTTQGPDMQFILDHVLKRKFSNFENNSACLSTLKKIYCAEFAPPCFSEDGEDIVLRTVCKHDCEGVKKECPKLYREHFGEQNYCEQMATEKSDLKGFCKLTRWPTVVRWPSHQGHVSTGPAAVPSTSVLYSSPSAPSSNSFSPGPLPLSTNVPTSGVVIIVSSAIALMSIIGITTALVLRKKQRLHFQGTTAMGYRYHVNDTGETVTSSAT
ncbi:uncharacterized protein LOC114955012 [Acropora millepora]|uniref:uncharacterized protein LOC114955012 n=1 Tax=Acropora millepora TaxID=45264 RepID=UPI001CF10693|nr:uncharacterized protein LOC114955012 [Acropora millepora]